MEQGSDPGDASYKGLTPRGQAIGLEFAPDTGQRQRHRRTPMDRIRRKILKTGAAATAMAAAAPEIFAQQGEAGMSFYQRGPVRIRYEVAGTGFPLLLIAGGGLNSTIAG